MALAKGLTAWPEDNDSNASNESTPAPTAHDIPALSRRGVRLADGGVADRDGIDAAAALPGGGTGGLAAELRAARSQPRRLYRPEGSGRPARPARDLQRRRPPRRRPPGQGRVCESAGDARRTQIDERLVRLGEDRGRRGGRCAARARVALAARARASPDARGPGAARAGRGHERERPPLSRD